MPDGAALNITFRDYPVTLLAGVPKRIPVSGDYYQVIESVDWVTLEFDQGTKVERQQGMGGPVQYAEVRVTSAVDQEVVLSLGFVRGLAPYDGRANVTGAVFNVVERVANTISPLPDVQVDNAAQATLAALDATRLGLWVTIPLVDAAGALIVSNLGVRIGDSTVAADKGTEMFPGDTRYFSGTHELRAFNNTGVNIKVSLASSRYV